MSEREKFEGWAYSNKWNINKFDDGTYVDSFVEGAFYGYKARVPDTHVVVPKEPTQELLNKMQDHFVGAFENGLTGGQSIHCAYIAMIKAQEQ